MALHWYSMHAKSHLTRRSFAGDFRQIIILAFWERIILANVHFGKGAFCIWATLQGEIL